MANIEHVDITDPDIHEPKGASSAAADTVYVADGAGSGDWTTVDSLLGVDSFSNMAKWVDQKAINTAGGTFTSGSWVTRTLNTEKFNTITGASIAGDIMTLPNGTYYIEASAPGYTVNSHKIRLFNSTSSATEIVGSSEFSANNNSSRSILKGQFTVSGGPKNYRIQHRCSSTVATNGLGVPNNFDEVEIYAEVVIWKLS